MTDKRGNSAKNQANHSTTLMVNKNRRRGDPWAGVQQYADVESESQGETRSEGLTNRKYKV
jgi:hypothetical protein